VRAPADGEGKAMSTAMFEIVELGDGEIVLRRPGAVDSPLVQIRFSVESRAYMGGGQLAVARAMIEAGIRAAARLAGNEAELDFVVPRDPAARQLH
jgi:hypothetical protein